MVGRDENGVGDVQLARGDFADALNSYRDWFAIVEALAQSDPGNADWQRDLAVSYSKLGDVYRRSNNSNDALDALQKGQAINV